MELTELGEMQSRFADIVWEHAPVASGELVRICNAELGWKKPTTYSVLRKLCEKGIFENADGVVKAVYTREQFYSAASETLVNRTFGGSLPSFVAAFTANKTLTVREADEIKKLIDDYLEGNEQ